MLREIIKIDEDKCTGCGRCVPGCPEGALQLIDGKARLVSDLFCDGLGACIGECPEAAIHIEKREAEPYDERRVMEKLIRAGTNTVKAHPDHLKEHGESAYLKTAVNVLTENQIGIPEEFAGEDKQDREGQTISVCPGTGIMGFDGKQKGQSGLGDVSSRLTHWPVQLHLVSPRASCFKGADVLLAADCIAYAVGDFHKRFLRNKALTIACPKLDEGQEIYLAKLIALIDEARINTLTVLIMQVPCCSGLLRLARQAAEQAGRKIPIKKVIAGIQGTILQDDWG